jgi:hypothetical protein
MDPFREPPPPPLPPGFLQRLITAVGGNWRTSLGAVGVVGEVAALVGQSVHGPSWLAYGHALFLLLVGAGFVNAGDAKKVADLEAAMKALVIPGAGGEVQAAPPPPAAPPAPPPVA